MFFGTCRIHHESLHFSTCSVLSFRRKRRRWHLIQLVAFGSRATSWSKDLPTSTRALDTASLKLPKHLTLLCIFLLLYTRTGAYLLLWIASQGSHGKQWCLCFRSGQRATLLSTIICKSWSIFYQLPSLFASKQLTRIYVKSRVLIVVVETEQLNIWQLTLWQRSN